MAFNRRMCHAVTMTTEKGRPEHANKFAEVHEKSKKLRAEKQKTRQAELDRNAERMQQEITDTDDDHTPNHDEVQR